MTPTQPAKEPCLYQGYEFGAGSYKDSICIDGRLFDADNCDEEGRLFEPLDYIPCPMCCREAAIEYYTDRGEGMSREDATELVNDILANRGVK